MPILFSHGHADKDGIWAILSFIINELEQLESGTIIASTLR